MELSSEMRLKITIGAYLHDIGKVVYRAGETEKNHSLGGCDYLQSVGLRDEAVLAAVRYHHAKELKGAKLAEDSIAYLVYMADNIASAADRREKETEEKGGFAKGTPLASIFNLLNGNQGKMAYAPRELLQEENINCPDEKVPEFTAAQYQNILRQITDNLKGLTWSAAYVSSLAEILSATLSFVPSSTSRQEVADISLYDHQKLTAAFALAMADYLCEQGEENYRRRLFTEGQKFFAEKAFLLATLDMSGIQSFIYTIASEGALKTLRARSFYLDFLTEHIADELLAKLNLTRANLLYSGGGRADFLLPNTPNTRSLLEEFKASINAWLQRHFAISLYMALAYAPCSANDLKNDPQGSYSVLYRTRSEAMGEAKAHRYGAEEIIKLNEGAQRPGSRECKVCLKVAETDGEGLCPICAAIKGLSANILGEKYEFFAALKDEAKSTGLPLPGGYYLGAGSQAEARRWQDSAELRLYGKNRFYTGKAVTTRLLVGDYHTRETFEELAAAATGIKRLGVLRADVDNLGAAFALGFRRSSGDERYVTLSRTATLSRQLSLFFKLYIRRILAEPKFTLTGEKKACRRAAIVYAGGDDLFIVGAWDDIIELAVDINSALAQFTEGTLTMSAGIGIYKDSYPIAVMAEETAVLEEAAKDFPGKNALALPGGATYSWRVFEETVCGEKLRVLQEFFAHSDERGKNFLYNLLELLRERKEKINLARYLYTLSRLEPDKSAKAEAKESYRDFADKMLCWMQNDTAAQELITAMEIYVYLNREREESHGKN